MNHDPLILFFEQFLKLKVAESDKIAIQYIEMFMNVCLESFHIKNYNAVMQILYALSSSSISRLTNLLSISNDLKNQIQNLKNVFSSDNHYESYSMQICSYY
jgi:hypothetical protein